MSRKHFIAIAAALRAADADSATISALADVLASTNSRFDRARFVAACTPAAVSVRLVSRIA